MLGNSEAPCAPSLSLVVFYSQDLRKACEFYAALGCRFEEERHGAGPVHYSCQLGAVVFEIYPSESRSPSIRLGFQMPVIDPLMELVEPLGGAIITPPKDSPWGRRAVIEDPDGHRVELSEPVT